MTRILLPLHGFVGWNGGLDLVRLMRSALVHPRLHDPIELAFALPEASRARSLALGALRRWREWRTGGRHQEGGRAGQLRRTALEIAAGHPVLACNDRASGILDAARRFHADLVFPSMYPLGRGGPTRIGYIFDFQHRHLPHLFPARIRDNRDRHFRALAEDSHGLVVNSRSASEDVVRFLGVDPQRILALPFTPYAKKWWFETEPADAQHRHGIKGPYLLVCNHFWMHKDHATALRAFSRIRASAGQGDMQLVMTGDPVDHRHPRHYHDLTRLAVELGVKEHVHFLGLVPKRDQLALLRGCRLLLQPTHFEGGPGGGSVYEAVGMGIPAVVSDIPINREIEDASVTFFETGHPEDLADKILDALSRPRATPDTETLLARSDERLLHLGRCMTAFFSDIMQHQETS